MIALCVDDEVLLLDTLVWAVEQSPDIEKAYAFQDELDALDWARENDFDIAFLDIELHEMDGITLASKLRETRPDLPVIFCTGHGEYAVGAFEIHASGYVMKPIEPEAIQREIDYIKNRKQSTLLTVRCYGSFAVFDKDGYPVEFKRKKTKELLAALVYNNGSESSATKLCNMLWDDGEDLMESNKRYLWNLLSDLNAGLKKAGAEDVLGKNSNGHFVKMPLIALDETGKGREPYMADYKWAENGPLT